MHSRWSFIEALIFRFLLLRSTMMVEMALRLARAFALILSFALACISASILLSYALGVTRRFPSIAELKVECTNWYLGKEPLAFAICFFFIGLVAPEFDRKMRGMWTSGSIPRETFMWK